MLKKEVEKLSVPSGFMPDQVLYVLPQAAKAIK